MIKDENEDPSSPKKVSDRKKKERTRTWAHYPQPTVLCSVMEGKRERSIKRQKYKKQREADRIGG